MTDPEGSFSDVLSLLIPAEFSEGDERRLNQWGARLTVLKGGEDAALAPEQRNVALGLDEELLDLVEEVLAEVSAAG